MNENEREKQIQEKGLNAPRLSPEKIDSKIASFSYSVLPSGKSVVCEITLLNGFTVRGDSAVVSVENFNEEIGKEIAYENARKKIWELEAYLLQERLTEAVAERKETNCPSCGTYLTYMPPRKAGHQLECAKCGEIFTLKSEPIKTEVKK